MADTGGCIISNDTILVPDVTDDVLQPGYVVDGALTDIQWSLEAPMTADNSSDILQAGYSPDDVILVPTVLKEEPITGSDKVGE